jgi:hypothetical protein
VVESELEMTLRLLTESTQRIERQRQLVETVRARNLTGLADRAEELLGLLVSAHEAYFGSLDRIIAEE